MNVSLLKLTPQEQEELEELYAHMDPDQVEVIERDYIAAIAEQRAIAILDTAAARSAKI
jgi:hypothetical protein